MCVCVRVSMCVAGWGAKKGAIDPILDKDAPRATLLVSQWVSE